MKTILSNMVSVATLCLTSNAYTTDTFIDQQFHECGFTVARVHTHHELKMLTDTVYDRATKVMNDYCNKHDRDRRIQECYLREITEFEVTWKQYYMTGETLVSVKDMYKIYPAGLKSSRNDVVLDSIARLMQCETDKILHMKNDMVFNYWKDYKTLNLYSIDYYRNIWPNDKDNINHIQTFTLLNGSATVHVWKNALKIDRLDKNHRTKARELEGTTKPDMSFKMRYGDTMLVNPFVRFSTEDEGSRDEIRFLVNEYARYDKKLYKMSINEMAKTINSINTRKISHWKFREHGFVFNETHGSGELMILKSLAESVCDEASKSAEILQKREREKNKDSYQNRFAFTKKKDGKETISGQWGTRNGVEGYVQNVYKHNPFILEFVHNNNILTTMSELLGCRIQDMVHVRNDIISDQWVYREGKPVLSQWEDYKLNVCKERDEYNTWQSDDRHSCHITAITVVGAGVDMHIWPDTITLKPGSTVYVNSSYLEFSFALTPRELPFKKVCFYVNGFAYPGTCKITKPIVYIPS